MNKFFINSQNRLRAGWRMLVQFSGWNIILIFIANIIIASLNLKSAWLFGAAGVVYILLGLAFTRMIARRLDKRRFADLGFRLDREWRLDLGVGFALGALMLAAVFAIEYLAGWLTITSTNQTTLNGPLMLTGLGTLLVMAGIAFNEELVFRGYQLLNLSEGLPKMKKSNLGMALMMALTSLLFAFMHFGSPNNHLLGWTNIFLAGMLLAWGYVLTGQLALPIGFHLAWNFFEQFVFGYAANGEAPVGWLIGSQVNGPALWTGGSFGPDGGLLITLLLALNTLLIAGWVKARNRWQGMRGYLAEE